MDEAFDKKQLRTLISQKLVETGEKERLKELLRTKLIECGWKDELKSTCRNIIESKGLQNITVEGLVNEITPKARDTIPEYIKVDILQRIRLFLEENVPTQT